MALAREQQVSALGGLAAAAAHELGSPLGTIAVVVKEISRDTPPDNPLAEDIALLQSQVERCREILARLSRRPADSRAVEAFADPGIANQIGRGSCRERVCPYGTISGVAVTIKKQKTHNI